MVIGASTSQDLSTYLSLQHETEEGCPAIGKSECCPRTFLDPTSLQKNRDRRTSFQDFPIQRDRWNDRSSAISCARAPYLFQGPHKLYEGLL